MLQIERLCKDRWCAIVRPKSEYAQTVPHIIAGTFGQYYGYSLDKAKGAVRKGFDVYNSAADKTIFNHATHRIFSRQSAASEMLYDFGHRYPQLELHRFVEAFVLVQEICFGTSVDRYMESQHKIMKHAILRGLRYLQPAMAAVRQRQTQLSEALTHAATYVWTVANWSSRTLFTQLLAHSCTSQ